MQPSLWEPPAAERRAALAVGSIAGTQAAPPQWPEHRATCPVSMTGSFLLCICLLGRALSSEPCSVLADQAGSTWPLMPLHKGFSDYFFCPPSSFFLFINLSNMHSSLTTHTSISNSSPLREVETALGVEQLRLKMQHCTFLVTGACISSVKVGATCQGWSAGSVGIDFFRH